MTIAAEVLWRPGPDSWETSNIGAFARTVAKTGPRFEAYDDLWQWSVAEPALFWGAIWQHFDIRSSTPYGEVLTGAGLLDARWFSGARLNYAEQALRPDFTGPAIVAHSQTRAEIRWSYDDLREQVARCRAGLKRLGVTRGVRVVGYLPNVPETIAVFLAASSLGAIWASCPPEFGARSVIDRFQQIEPEVLIAVDGYRYGDRLTPVREQLDAIKAALPSLRATILLPYLGADTQLGAGEVPWSDFVAETAPLAFEQVAFDHPLYVLYSSGTTGLPKAILHGHGGILLEHCKNIGLHLDVRRGDRFFWYTTTGWMMWNLITSGLVLGATVVLFDGNPAWPDLGALWRLIGQSGLTYFGVSASFLLNCQNNDVRPAEITDVTSLRAVGSTGSSLSPSTARWFYRQMPGAIQLGSGSGGTDICSGFVGAAPVKSVYADRMSCRYLGAKVEAFDEDGRSVIDEMGELVITAPLPSMPVGFWGDPDGSRYRDAYFDYYPGIWRHGDWITFDAEGRCTIHGRSDATLNRGGVRLGTGEFYALVDTLPGVADSLIIHIEDKNGGMGELLLFLARKLDAASEEVLSKDVKAAIRKHLSPRHVPDTIKFVRSIPRTLSGKKLELPVKRILVGAPVETVVSRGSLADEGALEDFVAFANART